MRHRTMARLYPYRRDKGPNGRGLCRYCGEEVPKGRRTWCSDEHFETAMLATDSSFQRRKVYERDKGVCADCGCDTVELKRLVRDMFKNPDGLCYDFRVQDFLRAIGFKRHQSLWEVDHIIPVIEGGQELGLKNLRTLCVPCHKKDTAEVVKRKALRAKEDVK